MTKIERVQAALVGKEVDRVPASFFFHFPEDRRAGHAMAQAHLEYYRAADPDFLKVMNDNYYEAPGVDAVATLQDWSRLRPAPLSSRPFQDQLSGLRELVDALGDEVMIVTTVFNPFLNGDGLSNWRAFEFLTQDPEVVSAGLATIAESLSAFAGACIEAGATGIFFAAHGGETDRVTEADFRRFVKPHDVVVLQAAEDAGATFNLLHIHGRKVRLKEYADYPAHVVNWAPQLENLRLSEGRRLFRRTVMGGVDEQGVIAKGTREEIAVEVRAALKEAGKTAFMLGAGCAVPNTIAVERLTWAREAVV